MRRRLTDSLDFEVGELNLVPYMDIMVNLIIFMLFSMTGFVQMKIINVSVPSISQNDTANANSDDDKKQLSIALAIIDKKGFVLTLDSQFMLKDGTLVDQLPENDFTLKLDADGKYDYDALRKLMIVVKGKAPEVSALTLTADKTVDYQTLVKTMDAIRYDDLNQLLYPDVLLGVTP